MRKSERMQPESINNRFSITQSPTTTTTTTNERIKFLNL
jgi:hypothetical protein